MWFYQIGAEASASLSEEDFIDLMKDGTIKPSTLVWSAELDGWTQASQVTRFWRFLSPPDLPGSPPLLPVSVRSVPGVASSTFSPSATEPEGYQFPVTAEQLALELQPNATPWARYFARMIDINIFCIGIALAIGLISAIYFPDAYVAMMQMNEAAFGILVLFLSQLTIALIMTLTGTTPGKAIVGIRVQPIGRYTGFSWQVLREMNVWVKGLGLGFPIISLFTLVFQHGRVKRGEPASYDVGTARVIPKNAKPRTLLGFAAWAVTIGAVILLFIADDIKGSMAATTQTWTNPLSDRSAAISGAWTQRPIDGKDVVYLASDYLLGEAVLGREEIGSAFSSDVEYATALEKALSDTMTVYRPWQTSQVDGRTVLEAAATHKTASGVDILLTVYFQGSHAWRTILFATGRNVADHDGLLALRRQLWSTIPL